MKLTKKITCIDLCAGVGGWACASRGLPIKYIAIVDHAPDCLETWSLNHAAAHPRCKPLCLDLAAPDAVAQVLAALGRTKIDLIVGGIPCEQVSCARGNRPLKEGELETLHRLIDNCFALVKALTPRWWCFEDVEAIVSHLPAPIEWGTNYEVRKICAADYGPQNRERVFIGVFPPLAPAEPGPRVLGDVLRPGPYRTLPNLAKYTRSKSRWYGRNGRKDGPTVRVNDLSQASPTILSSQGNGGVSNDNTHTVPLARVQNASETSPAIVNGSSRHERALLVPTADGEGLREAFGREKPCPADPVGRAVVSGKTSPQLVEHARDPFSRERPQSTDEASRTLAVGSGGGSANPIVDEAGLVRVMEWQEAALLQGFPTDFVFAASWSKTWKMVAQAIPIQVGKCILRGVVAEAQSRGKKNGR